MSRIRPPEQRKIAGLSCGQALLLFLLVVVIAAAAAIGFGYFLGVFDRGFPPVTSPTASAPDIVSETLIPESTRTVSQAETDQATQVPSIVAFVTPTQTVVSSSPATPTVTTTPPPTVPENICAQVSLGFLDATSNVAAWRLRNTSGQLFRLRQIEIAWPVSNDAIFNAVLSGRAIWSGEDLVSPTFITNWSGEPDDRTIDELARLELFFGMAAAEQGYELTLSFENGCEVSHSH